MTDGKYYAASSANELLNVFQKLPTYLITKHEVMEISVLFAALGIAAGGIIYFVARKPAKFLDLGAVSSSWLAEHRTGPHE